MRVYLSKREEITAKTILLNLTNTEIKQKISARAQKHAASNETIIDDFMDSKLLERDAKHLIIQYCENQGYLINGFPTEMKRRYENDEINDEE